jgi:colicin import membrane protein
MTMKRLFLSMLLALPLTIAAQDNTWEKIEQEPTQNVNRDAKYLEANAVPEVDGVVCWETTVKAPGKSASQIYDILLAQMEKMTKECLVNNQKLQQKLLMLLQSCIKAKNIVF